MRSFEADVVELVAAYRRERLELADGDRGRLRTLGGELWALSAALKWMRAAGHLAGPPVTVPSVRVDPRPPTTRLLTDDEIRVLFREARGTNLEVVLRLAEATGLRLGEIVALTWDDVDLTAGTVAVQPKRGWSPKSRRAVRVVPLREDLHRYLEGLRACGADAHHVAEREPGHGWHLNYLSQLIRKLFDRAGIDRSGRRGTLHRLRHTLATRLVEVTDLENARDILGHSSITITAAYLWATDKRKRAAIEALKKPSEDD